MLARIVLVGLEGLSRPARERVVVLVVLHGRTRVEAQFAPRDELIEKRFRACTQAPKALSCAVADLASRMSIPVLGLHELGQDLMACHVSEVEPRRETAAGIG